MSSAETKSERSVVVSILGEEYVLAASSDPNYIAKVADIVDQRMREVARDSAVKARDKVAILTAMSFASELYEKSLRLETIETEQTERLGSLLHRLDSALTD